MSRSCSPLRYPGGKQVLARVLARLIRINSVEHGVYAEPYAGGAGAALSLLFGDYVERICINDADPCVYAFWRAVLNQTEAFIDLVQRTPTTVTEWRKQRDIYRRHKQHSQLRVAFATFYLNRCNRSGIIVNGGPIGGVKQTGKWKLDARFNREELERRIRRIVAYRDRITVTNLDALAFLATQGIGHFVYLDPPYYGKGKDLYLNHYEAADHARLAAYIKRIKRFTWTMSYDNVDEITGLYSGLRRVPFDLSYSARERRTGSEVLILQPELLFPDEWHDGLPNTELTTADEALLLPAVLSPASAASS